MNNSPAVGGGPDTDRIAFRMRLKPGGDAAYQRIHDGIWREMVELIRASGVTNYSIFRDGLDLFAYCEVSGTSREQLTRANPVLARWWDELEPYMDYTPDHKPRTWPMVEMFHQD